MNEAGTELILFFGSLVSICLCCIITVKCKVTKKINNRVEKIRKRFISVHVEENIETTNEEIVVEELNYDDIESNLKTNCEENRPANTS